MSKSSGSLSNPEEIKDVPGHVIPIIAKEFDDFDTEAGRFLSGDLDEANFIGFRLKQGVYGQRQPGVNMIRVKVPWGGITAEQLEAFGDAVEQFAPLRKGHITTRQAIQIHHVPLEKMPDLMRVIAPSGLSSREGCGNTVRNVTGDPWAGVCENELFDPTPYVGAYVRYFVRHETTQLMPRKVKTAFTATDEDRAITGIHDIAFIPRIKDGKRGFEIRIGGGTSIMARVAPTLYEFVEADNGDYLKVSEAVFRIFDAQDWLRVNRARARIKVLVDRDGIDAVREMVEEELKGDWVAQRDFSIDERLFEVDEEQTAPAVPESYGSPNGDISEFQKFVDANVQPQRQEGFSTIHVRVIRGDLNPKQFRGLGAIVREYCGGHARTTAHQNLVLRWVRNEAIYDVWQKLKEINLGTAGADRIVDVVSCPGTDSCKLGITASMGLNKAIQERVESLNITDELTQKIHIKMSGCPNGCSQHHIGNIGFYGASIKVGEHTLPAYVAHLGGNFEGGEVIFGTRLKVRIPAKRVPDVVERWLAFYQENRNDGEVFNAFVERIGTTAFEDEIRELALPAEYSNATVDEFIDWNRSDKYEVQRGEGECAV